MGKGNQVPVSPRIEHRANEVVQDIGVVRCAENVRGARISQVRPDAQARSYALGEARDRAVQVEPR